MSVFDRLARLERAMGEGAASQVRETPLGTALLSPDIPAAYDANALIARPGVGVVELVAHLDELYGGLAHRKAWVYDDDAGARIAPGMRDRGYAAERGIVLVLRGDPPAVAGLAEEVTRDELDVLERAELIEDDGMTPDVADQLLRMRDRTADAVPARFFAAAGSAHARSYRHGDLASITDVGTRAAARGRGLARSVIALATRAALRDGVRDVVLVTDSEDWMQGFYRRLGFTEEAGAVWAFTETGR